MHSLKWNALLSAVAVTALFSVGCPNPDEKPDAGTVEDAGPEDAGEVDAGGDPNVFPCASDSQCENEFRPGTVCDDIDGSATFGTCVERCSNDEQCTHYQQGLRCQETTGHCVLGRGCTNDTNCPPQNFDPNDYCNESGPGCRCVTEDHPSGLGGVCRRRLTTCDECTFDEQCGSGAIFDPQGRCRPLQGDPDGILPDGGVRKYCFQQSVSGTLEGCPGCGFTMTSDGFCVPQLSCSQIGCGIDADCPFGSVCGNTGATCGLCEPRCSWNFDSKKENPPGCRPGFSCWVDKDNLNPNSPFFGAGRCRPTCETDDQCEQMDPRLECRGEQLAGGGESAKRCRPKGECMDDFECPQPQPGDIYLGYCDRSDFECKTDCRTGTDPTTGQDYDDCTSGYKCLNKNGANVCEQMSCLEQGGARIACPTAHFCCGEDKNGDGQADPCPSTGLSQDQCYLADRPPFCQTCETHADCEALPNPSGSILPHRCIQLPPKPDMSPGATICGIATHNDWAVDATNVSKAHRGCPAKYTPMPLKQRCPSGMNSECGPGGLCEPDPYERGQDGEPILTCLCTADGTGTKTAGCPSDPANGIIGYCRHAPAGTLQYCLSSVVCMPGGNSVYTTENFGCGFP